MTPRPIKIPKMFFDDHCLRFEKHPKPVNESARYVWLDPAGKHFKNLIGDAKHYSDDYGPDACPEIKRAAVRMLNAMDRQK
jgi:hypothetical protein